MMKTFGLCAAAVVGLCLSGAASASELHYQPTNPNFGGNPLNGNYLQTQAQQQGKVAKQSQKQQQQQMPDITFPDLSGIGSSSPVIIIGGTGSNATIPTNP
jgi:curli production assembly/transport component CsgF